MLPEKYSSWTSCVLLNPSSDLGPVLRQPLLSPSNGVPGTPPKGLERLVSGKGRDETLKPKTHSFSSDQSTLRDRPVPLTLKRNYLLTCFSRKT